MNEHAGLPVSITELLANITLRNLPPSFLLTKSAPAEFSVTLLALVVASASHGRLPIFVDSSEPSLTLHSFESRDICDEVIKAFNNTPVSKPGGEEHLIQIRFSDTHEQKMLKQQTQAGRVFRAAEYEVGVAQARALGTPDRYLTISPPVTQGSTNEFEMYIQRPYRTPYAPAIPSTLGGNRPTMYHMTQNGGAIKSDGSGSDHGVEARTNPATPIKAEDKTLSPTRPSGRDE